MNNLNSDNPPVEVGDVLELVCRSVGEKGDGLFRVDRYVLFAPGAEIDRVYKLRVKKVTSQCGFAEVVEEV